MKYSNDFPIAFLKQYQLTEEIHFSHNTFDIVYILSGKIMISTDSERPDTYIDNQITLLHSQTPYTFLPCGDNVILHVGFKPEFTEKYMGSDHKILCDSVQEPNRNYLPVKQLLSGIAAQYMEQSSDHTLSIYSQIFQLMDVLSKEYTLSLPSEAAGINPKYFNRVDKIQEYITRNYDQNITLSSMADALHLTPQYLSKFFKSCFSVNFSEYLNKIRIEHAVRDIRYSSERITDIAIRHGFPNISTFNRNFREIYGTSPRDYRKQFQQQLHATSNEWSYENMEVPKLITSASLNNREITADVENTTEFLQNFSALINVGSAKNLLSDALKQHFVMAHKILHFRYVRLEGLVSNALIQGFTDGQHYHFASVVEILDFLYSQDTIPFIELGKNSFDYPNAYSQTSFYRSYRSSRKFLALLEAFLSFVASRYDAAWLSQWKFELWKTPDESMANYLNAFTSIQALIRQYIPGAAFGGPGYDTARNSDVFVRCLHAFKENQIHPDFISAHLFAIQYAKENPEDSDSSNSLSPLARSLHQQQEWQLRQIQGIMGSSIPLYITEFNSTLIPQTFINDSCFQAAFLCKNLLDFHSKIPLIGYWMLSDLAFFIADPGAHMLNGISMINQSGIKMPSFHTYALLGRLGPRLIDQGDSYCITRDSKAHYQILAYNYAAFSNYQSLLEKQNHSLRDVYSYYDEPLPIKMTFHLTNLPSGTYRIRRYLLDREHGSLIDIQLGGLLTSTIDEDTYLNKIQTPSPAAAEYLISACVPEERDIYLDIADALTVTTTIYPHNVCLWDIVREF